MLLQQNFYNISPKVRFALSSSSVFSRTDTTTDSETFYHSLLDLLEDPEESQEIDELLTWWNRSVFLSPSMMSQWLICPTSSVKFSLLLLLPEDLPASTVPYSRSGKGALPSNKQQFQMLSIHSFNYTVVCSYMLIM